MKNDVVYLKHIRDAMRKISRYISGKSKEDFLKEELLQDGVIRQLEVIGEAVKNLSFRITLEHPEIPWKGMAGLRDILIHKYNKIDLERVWKIVSEDIPKTLERIERLLERM